MREERFFRQLRVRIHPQSAVMPHTQCVGRVVDSPLVTSTKRARSAAAWRARRLVEPCNQQQLSGWKEYEALRRLTLPMCGFRATHATDHFPLSNRRDE